MNSTFPHSLGVESDRDAALRGLFRDDRFRKAVAYALDRDGIAQTIIRGPFLRGFPGGLVPGASEFDYDSTIYYPYDPASAQALLADIGFEDTDGNGILNWTEGPLAGDDLVITMHSSEDQAAAGQTVEAVAALLREVGVQINPLLVTSTASQDMEDSGTWEMRVTRTGQHWLTPFTRCTDLGPVTQQFPYHREGADPRELLPFEEELVGIINEFCGEADSTRRAELMSEYQRIFTENNYHVGTVIGRYGLALASRFNNLPTGAPPFFYQWTWGNVRPEQMWIAAEDLDLVAETQPGVLPLYNAEE